MQLHNELLPSQVMLNAVPWGGDSGDKVTFMAAFGTQEGSRRRRGQVCLNSSLEAFVPETDVEGESQPAAMDKRVRLGGQS